MDTHKIALLIGLLLLLVAAPLRAASPSFWEFNTNHFVTNGTPWEIELRPSIEQVVGLPFNQLKEFWYDPFAGSAYNSDGTYGQLGWAPQNGGVGGAGMHVTNAANHFGLIAILTTGTATSMQAAFLSTHHNTKPSLPRLDTSVWTNRIIWRLLVTNDVRMYLVFQNGDITHNATMNNGIGFQVDTNSNQIKGYCASGGSVSTTNLTTLQADTWFTNQCWSLGATTIYFTVNDGPIASIASNIPTSGLTPKMGVVKTATSAAVTLQVDSWLLIWPN